MKFLMLIKHAESYRSEAIPQALMDAMGEFVNEGLKSGVNQPVLLPSATTPKS